MSRTPHKGVVQPFTPGKGGVKEGGMRRSISTPSLLSQHSSTRPLTASTKRKLKGESTCVPHAAACPGGEVRRRLYQNR